MLQYAFLLRSSLGDLRWCRPLRLLCQRVRILVHLGKHDALHASLHHAHFRMRTRQIFEKRDSVRGREPSQVNPETSTRHGNSKRRSDVTSSLRANRR